LDPAPFALADAAGAGCAGSVCAAAIAVAPNNEATTRAEIASLDRKGFLLIRINDAGVKTGEPNEGSLARERNSEIQQPFRPAWRCGGPYVRLGDDCLNVRSPQAPTRSRIIPVIDIGRFVDQRGGDVRVPDRSSKFEKRCDLTHVILSADHCTHPASELGHSGLN
jgi:hypothetical protein